MIYRIRASDLLYYTPPSVKCTVLGQVINRIEPVIYFIIDPRQSNVPFWGMWSTILGQVIYCIIDPPQSNVPFWGKWSTVLGQVIYCIIVPLSQIHRLGQVIYRIGASDLLYYGPPQSNPPFGAMIYRIGASYLLYYRHPLVKCTVFGQVIYCIEQVIYWLYYYIWGKWSTVL